MNSYFDHKKTMNCFLKVNAILRQLFHGRVEYTEEEKRCIRAQCNPCPIVKALKLNDPEKLKEALVNTPNVALKLQEEWTYWDVYFNNFYYGGIDIRKRKALNLVDDNIVMTNGDHLQCILLLLQFGGKLERSTMFLIFHYEYLQIYLAGGVCNSDMFSYVIFDLCVCGSCLNCKHDKIAKNILEMWPISMLLYCLLYKNSVLFL